MRIDVLEMQCPLLKSRRPETSRHDYEGTAAKSGLGVDVLRENPVLLECLELSILK